MHFKRFNDPLALFITAIVPAMVLVERALHLNLSGEILGIFTGGWLLVLNFYFRKAKDAG